jgi:hypothetical protein
MKGLQEEGVLAGLLDLEHVIIGGHSAGGRVAITTGRPFLDYSPTQPLARIRARLAEAMVLFIEAQVERDPEARERLQRLAKHPLAASFERK